MVNIYLFIELLSAANAEATMSNLERLELANCKLIHLVKLSEEKLVAQLDCETYGDAVKAVLDRMAPVEGIVQTNLIAAVRPTEG